MTKRRFTDEFKALPSEVEGREAVAGEANGWPQTGIARALGIMPTMSPPFPGAIERIVAEA